MYQYFLIHVSLKEYQFGDISRYTLKQITKAWKQQFGKDYEFGDITRSLLQRAAQTAESERWKDRLLEEMESLQRERGKSYNKKQRDMETSYRQKKRRKFS